MFGALDSKGKAFQIRNGVVRKYINAAMSLRPVKAGIVPGRSE